MPKYLYKEGILDRFIDSIFNNFKKKQQDRLITKMKKEDPELANKIKDWQKRSDDITKHVQSGWSKEDWAEFKRIQKL